MLIREDSADQKLQGGVAMPIYLYVTYQVWKAGGHRAFPLCISQQKTAVHVSVIISASEITDKINIVCPKEGCYMKLAICDDDKKIRELIEESVREVSGYTDAGD